MVLTSFHWLLSLLFLHTSIRLFRCLRLQRRAYISRTSSIKGSLERIIFPAEEIIAVPAVASTVTEHQQALQMTEEERKLC